MAPFVGHKPVLPQQNVNDWKRGSTGEAGVYSNWSLQSTTHLLQDVGHPDLPDHSEYNTRRRGWQVFTGEFEYNPMELAKYTHGGQSAPYLRHINYENHSVPSSDVFPRFEEPLPANAVLGHISTAANDFSEDNLTFTLTVDGGTAQNVTIDGDYSTRQQLLDALNAETDGVTFYKSSPEGNLLVVQSATSGANSSIVIEDVANPGNSGVEATSVTGQAAVGLKWGQFGWGLNKRQISTSRHSNLYFYGVESANKTLGSGGFQPLRGWDDEDLPSYARRHAPHVNKGVTGNPLEGSNVVVSSHYERADESNAYGWQRPNVWKGVDSARAL